MKKDLFQMYELECLLGDFKEALVVQRGRAVRDGLL